MDIDKIRRRGVDRVGLVGILAGALAACAHQQDPAPVFIDGQKAMTLRGPTLAQDFMKMVEDYIEKRFGQGGTRTPLRAAE